MSNDDSASVENLTPDPIPDADQRLILATELGTYRQLLADDALTVDGMQRLNHRLRLPDGPINPADANQHAHRQAVLAELHARLTAATGVPLDYWEQVHRPDVPDDARALGSDE